MSGEKRIENITKTEMVNYYPSFTTHFILRGEVDIRLCFKTGFQKYSPSLPTDRLFYRMTGCFKRKMFCASAPMHSKVVALGSILNYPGLED